MRTAFICPGIFIFVIASSSVPAIDAEPAQEKELRADYIAVLDLATQDVDSTISLPATESMRQEIVRSGKYKVINRGDMNMLLGEQMFQIADCVTGSCTGIVEAGHLLRVGKIITGSVSLIGKSYFLSLSLIDVNTGNIVRVAEDKCSCRIDDLIDSSKRLIKRLLGEKVKEVPSRPHAGKEEEGGTQKTGGVLSEGAVPKKVQTFSSAADMEFIPVKGGCYMMGDTFGDGFREERPAHEVCVGDFSIGMYLVTQGQWKDIMNSNPSEFSLCGDRCPVENISWNDTREYIKKLEQRLGGDYRLPTEAEWEYAARSGGMQQKWAGTSTKSEIGEYAWYHDNSDYTTHPVGMLKPNGLGLYDMTGNVWEWVQDSYDRDYYSRSPKNNPAGPASGAYRILRGGSSSSGEGFARTTDRFPEIPDYRLFEYGCRLVRTK